MSKILCVDLFKQNIIIFFSNNKKTIKLKCDKETMELYNNKNYKELLAKGDG